jgi:hypothetical protein
MASLKFYEVERIQYQTEFEMTLGCSQARIVFDKLARHFKIRQSLEFRNICGGNCSRWYIKVGYDTNVGILCHEIAHAIQFKKYGHFKHNKKLAKILARVIKYCLKHNYWDNELTRRLTPKPAKVITDNERKVMLIQHKKQKLAWYEKRLKYFTKLYSRKISSVKRSIAMLTKHLEITPAIATNNTEKGVNESQVKTSQVTESN